MKTYPVEIEQPGSQPKFYSAEYQVSQGARLQSDLERAWNYDLQARCLCQQGKSCRSILGSLLRVILSAVIQTQAAITPRIAHSTA